jgi:hypothetical protein
VRRGVDQAASQICAQYLAEIQSMPPLDALDVQEFVSEILPSNIFSQDEAVEACRRYNEMQGHACHGDCRDRAHLHPLCMLYSVGLVGWVQRSPAHGRLEQVFMKPGEARPLEGMQRLPTSNWYLVHPVMTNLLGPERLNTRHIVGHGLPFDESLLR